MPDSYVTSVTVEGGKIRLNIKVDEFAEKPKNSQVDGSGNGQYVEISGQATQTSGAFANFYDIQRVPDKPDDTGHYYIQVSGAPIPHQFREDRHVTVVLRAARVWMTVLGSQSDPEATEPPKLDRTKPPAPNGTTWDRDPRPVQLASDGSWGE